VVTCQMLIFLTVPFLLDYYMGLTTRGAGFILVVALGTSLLFLVPAGIVADYIGSRPLENAGIFFIALSLGVLAFVGSRITMDTAIVSMALLGVGGGLFASANYSAVMGSVPRASLGVAGGMYGASTTIGTFFAFALSDAVMGRWGDLQGSDEGARLALFNPQFHSALRHVFVAGFIVAVAGLMVCLWKYRSQPGTEPVPRASKPLKRARPLPGED
jgi:MFS family permease